MDSKLPLVTIWCLTYNHKPYIEQCIKGFISQKTNFDFEVLIHDDASTDGTQQIILEYAQKYPQLIKPLLDKENLYSRHDGSLMNLQIKMCKSRYIAFCEGDDYWSDSMKLQKQVDFMESHPNYGMCHTDFSLSDGSRRRHYTERYPDGDYFPGIIEHDNVMIGTLTVLFRKETFDRTHKYYLENDFIAVDKARWIELSKEAKIKYIPERTACYRILENSASHSPSIEKNIAFMQGSQEIREFYAHKYNISLQDYNTYYTNLLRTCYMASSAEMAEKFYIEAKAKKSVTMRGFVFYMGAKSRFLHYVLDLIIKPK